MVTIKEVYSKTLYKDSKQWSVSVIDNGEYAIIEVGFGKIGGKIQTKRTTIECGKNIGRANETTYIEQAISEAESKVNKQKDKLYEEGIRKTATVVNKTVLPMLAQSYDKYSHKISFPCFLQPKLDGCLSGDSLIKTKEYGYKAIKWLVENKIQCSVSSFNQNGKIEYNEIINWFLNREYDEKVVWYEIELETGEKLKLTGNHKVYLPDLKCYRRVDELEDNQNLMVI